MKLEVGKRYKLKNGVVCLCDGMRGDDPSAVNESGYGPFALNGSMYHQDGRFGNGDWPSLDVVAEWTEDDELNAIADERKDGPFVAVDLGEPKTWGEMTDAEKGALLLAYHDWIDIEPEWSDHVPYRIKPEPVVGEVVLYGDQSRGISDFEFTRVQCNQYDTHTLTLPTLDGNLVCGEFTDKDGNTVKVEEKK